MKDAPNVMNTKAEKWAVWLSAIAGAALGFILLHPYTMAVYGFYEQEAGQGLPMRIIEVFRNFGSAFHPRMIYMGLPFALLGAASGLFFGFWLVARRRRQEMELRACAVDTLKQLMVTLSHYLLNAGTVIGGFAARAMKKTGDEETRRHLGMIKKEAECIENVVKSLNSLQDVVTDRYSKDSETLIIDITRELEQRLEEGAERLEEGVDANKPDRRAS